MGMCARGCLGWLLSFGVVLFVLVLLVTYPALPVLLSLLFGGAGAVYFNLVSGRTCGRILRRAVCICLVAFLVLPLLAHNQHGRCTCDYCVDLNELKNVYNEEDMPPSRWASYGQSGRPVIIQLRNDSVRSRAFSWKNIAWSASTLGLEFERARVVGEPFVPNNVVEPISIFGIDFTIYRILFQKASMKLFASDNAASRWATSVVLDSSSLLAQLPHNTPSDFEWYFSWVYNGGLTPEMSSLWHRRFEMVRWRFLPSSWELTETLWFFLGSVATDSQPLEGRLMHKDLVGNSGTFHVQIAGSKQWMLMPLPHCAAVCGDRVTLTVDEGQVISLNTDKWYHNTAIPFTPGSPVSLSIAREYRSSGQNWSLR